MRRAVEVMVFTISITSGGTSSQSALMRSIAMRQVSWIVAIQKYTFRQCRPLSDEMHLRRQSLNRTANPERSSGGPIGKEPANSVANAEVITRTLGLTPWFWSTRTLMKCDAAAVPKFLLAV